MIEKRPARLPIKALIHLCGAIAEQHSGRKSLRVNARRSSSDPTGQARHRQKTSRRINKRLAIAEREVKALFKAIPRTRRLETVLANTERDSIYAYDLPTTGAIGLTVDVRNAIDRALGTVSPIQPPADWWFEPVIDQPYRQGTAEEIRDFNQLVSQAAAAGVTAAGGFPLLVTDPTDVLLSQEYLERIRAVTVRNYGLIKSLSERTADQVMQQITLGIDAGNTPTEIRQAITERFDVAESSAKRITNTEINRAYNDARLDAAEAMSKRTGLRAGVLHISALIPTTRKHHASRHGEAHTPASQRSWWNSGVNRIECLCTTRSVLIDANGKVVDQSLQKEIKNEGAEFFKDQ